MVAGPSRIRNPQNDVCARPVREGSGQREDPENSPFRKGSPLHQERQAASREEAQGWPVGPRSSLEGTLVMTNAMRLLTPFLLISITAASASQRPKIGVALGGGSAKGFAHVGVLEWLEEHRIPIDYVAGTSMGGLVGGAYATGMTPAELRQLLRNIDWDLTFLGEPPYKAMVFRRKQDRRDLPVKIELGLKDGLSLPSGLDPAHQVGLLLSRISFPYKSDLRFDDLPTPFRAVATDLQASEVLVLEQGSLSQSLLATMALPAVFPPVEIDGKLLADGGMLNNVPADVVRAMGADFVIAVNVGQQRDDVEVDALGQAGQAITVMMESMTRQALADADLVIRPNLQGLGSLDWRRSETLADRGYQAAEAAAPALLELAISESEWSEWARERLERKPDNRFVPEFLEVRGTSPDQQALVMRRLDQHLGEPIDFDVLADDLTWITGSARFERLRYEACEQGGEPGLLIVAQEKRHGPPFVRFGLDMDNERQDLKFGFTSRLIALNVGKVGAEVRADVAVGQTLGAGIEYYWPFGGSHFFFAPRAFTFRRTRNVFENEEFVAIVRNRLAAVGGDVGFTTFRSTEFRFGYQLGDAKDEIAIGSVGDRERPQLAGREELLRFRFAFDGMDAPIIPRQGIRTELDTNWLLEAPGATEEFGLARGIVTIFQPLAARDRVFISGQAGSSFSQNAPFPYEFTLGGPFRLSSFDREQFRGQKFILASGGYLRTIARLPDFLGGNVYVTGIVEIGSAFDDFDDAIWHGSASGGVVMDTLLGPVLVAMAFGDEGSSRFYFTVGNLFR